MSLWLWHKTWLCKVGRSRVITRLTQVFALVCRKREHFWKTFFGTLLTSHAVKAWLMLTLLVVVFVFSVGADFYALFCSADFGAVHVLAHVLSSHEWQQWKGRQLVQAGKTNCALKWCKSPIASMSWDVVPWVYLSALNSLYAWILCDKSRGIPRKSLVRCSLAWNFRFQWIIEGEWFTENPVQLRWLHFCDEPETKSISSLFGKKRCGMASWKFSSSESQGKTWLWPHPLQIIPLSAHHSLC